MAVVKIPLVLAHLRISVNKPLNDLRPHRSKFSLQESPS
jgi:hypothetical protein